MRHDGHGGRPPPASRRSLAAPCSLESLLGVVSNAVTVVIWAVRGKIASVTAFEIRRRGSPASACPWPGMLPLRTLRRPGNDGDETPATVLSLASTARESLGPGWQQAQHWRRDGAAEWSPEGPPSPLMWICRRRHALGVARRPGTVAIPGTRSAARNSRHPRVGDGPQGRRDRREGAPPATSSPRRRPCRPLSWPRPRPFSPPPPLACGRPRRPCRGCRRLRPRPWSVCGCPRRRSRLPERGEA